MPFAQTIEEIRAQYPDQWVLIGDPELRDPQSLGTVLSKLVRGVVLFAAADRKEIALRAGEFRTGFDRYTCIYTGERSMFAPMILSETM